jgi:hypothetical protein
MYEVSKFEPEMGEYFDSLPDSIKQSIKESNVKINSLEELKKCAENLMNKKQGWQ